MLQYGPFGLVSKPSEDERRLLIDRFRRRHWLLFKNFFTKQLLNVLVKKNRTEPYIARKTINGYRHVMKDPHASSLPSAYVGDRYIMDFIHDLSGSKKRLRSIGSKTFRMDPDPRYYSVWHDDVSVVAYPIAEATLIVNVGERFRGGELMIQVPGTKKIITKLSLQEPGSAVIFKNNLLHRGARVLGKKPKIIWVCTFSPLPPAKVGEISSRSHY